MAAHPDHLDEIRRFHAGDHRVDELCATKAASGLRTTVCLPARDEAATIGAIVTTIVAELGGPGGLVDEVLVVDDHSTDATADAAAAAGARVVGAQQVLDGYGTGPGKGGAMWKGLHEAHGDLIVWCDADVRDFTAGFVSGLLGPLLQHPDVAFVKGFYERPIDGNAVGGGRVTELVARPLLSLLFPQLATIVQPLSGEYGGRRELLEKVPFVNGYGVDLGLLIDVAAMVGPESIAQVDLGVRTHRNRPLDELSPQATAVLATALRRADPELLGTLGVLVRPDGSGIAVDVSERPPLCEVPEHRSRTR
ncbi:MAG: glucosyl-3-phosphoglycerate synthase [Acidimicrobiales bacterium]|nr:glucosyl-3-phosphoglycerate synthase [Acidimicrobiales bacterium]MCB1262184.1 glucosyl-3-phosphoglycerate synthase [Acidimicrobiales bacterium]